MQTKLLENYYSASGIEYTVGRVPIASCDFSTGVYSYDETAEDFIQQVTAKALTGRLDAADEAVLQARARHV